MFKNLKEKYKVRKLLKKILAENRFFDLPEALKKEGFSQIPEIECKKILIEDFARANLVTYVKQKYQNSKLELSWYTNLRRYEDRNVITMIYIDKSKGHLRGFPQGIFADATHNKQQQEALSTLLSTLSSLSPSKT